jgi:hypothetical protein
MNNFYPDSEGGDAIDEINDLLPIDGSYLNTLKAKSQEQQGYVYILQKIEETLDVFNIKDKRDAFSEALIRLTILEFNFPMHGADEKANFMFNMLKHFKKIAQS